MVPCCNCRIVHPQGPCPIPAVATPPARSAPETDLREMPPQRFIDTAVELSTFSPCRSKRGAVIFRENHRIGSGYNFKPRGFDCDGSAACKATCRHEAVHAEQMALMKAGLHAQGCDLLHVKTVDGQLVPSGGPSCVQCSKLALAAGIAGVWLFHAEGWKRYPIGEFHQLSLAAMASAPAPAVPQDEA